MDYSKIRKYCKKKLDERKKLDVDHRDTLLPCPACEGSGKLVDKDDVIYLEKLCPWCDGNGHTDRSIIAIYREYIRSGKLDIV